MTGEGGTRTDGNGQSTKQANKPRLGTESSILQAAAEQAEGDVSLEGLLTETPDRGARAARESPARLDVAQRAEARVGGPVGRACVRTKANRPNRELSANQVSGSSQKIG